LEVEIGLHRPFFRVQAAKTAAFYGHNAANMSIADVLDCASIRNFAENRLWAYICLYKLGLNYMGAILAVKFEKEILP
jgi:hypothetical protein